MYSFDYKPFLCNSPQLKVIKGFNVMALAIAEHVWKESHQVNWEAAEMLDLCRFQYPRCMLEWQTERQTPLTESMAPCPISTVPSSQLSVYHTLIPTLLHIPLHPYLDTYLLFSSVTFSHSLMMMLE